MSRVPEPSLEEILSDPITRLVMKSDGVTGADVRRVAYAARERLAWPRGREEARVNRPVPAKIRAMGGRPSPGVCSAWL
jgi:hypothetical protein